MVIKIFVHIRLVIAYIFHAFAIFVIFAVIVVRRVPSHAFVVVFSVNPAQTMLSSMLAV